MQVKALYLDPMQLREVHSSLLILSLPPRYKSRLLSRSRPRSLALEFSCSCFLVLSFARARAFPHSLALVRALSRVWRNIYVHIFCYTAHTTRTNPSAQCTFVSA
jgi:hypothetical protein